MHDMVDQELDIEIMLWFRYRNIKLRSGGEGGHNRAVGGYLQLAAAKM